MDDAPSWSDDTRAHMRKGSASAIGSGLEDMLRRYGVDRIRAWELSRGARDDAARIAERQQRNVSRESLKQRRLRRVKAMPPVPLHPLESNLIQAIVGSERPDLEQLVTLAAAGVLTTGTDQCARWRGTVFVRYGQLSLENVLKAIHGGELPRDRVIEELLKQGAHLG